MPAESSSVKYAPLTHPEAEVDKNHNADFDKEDQNQRPHSTPVGGNTNGSDDMSQGHHPNTIGRPWSQNLLGWRLEALSCALAIAVLLAIAGTIYPYQGKPSPEWPDVISLNTLLSIYTVVLKASLGLVVATCISQLQWSWFASKRSLLDIAKFSEAAEGSWGSLNWLWTHKLEQRLTAFGAFIMVIAVAIDPFTQQLIGYIDCSTVLEKSTATLPRTNYYVGNGIPYGQNKTIGQGPAGEIIEAGLQDAVLAGFFGAPYQTVVECSSGNCSFPETFFTVGFCSKCEDISDLISFDNQTCWDDNGVVGTCSAKSAGAIIISQLPEAADMLNSGGPVNLSMTWDSGSDDFTPTVGVSMVTDAHLYNYKIFSFEWVRILFGKTIYSVRGVDPATVQPISGCNHSSSAKNDPWRCRGYGAAQCTLQPCVREYSASVKAGNLQEVVASSTDPFLVWGTGDASQEFEPGLDVSPGTFALLDTHCTTPEENNELIAKGYDLQSASQGRWLPYNVTEGYHTSPSTAPYTRCVYAIDYFFAAELWHFYLEPVFNSTLAADVYNDPGGVAFVVGSPAMQAMYNMGNLSFARIEEIFRNVSDSMTATIRAGGVKGASELARGDVLHYATCLSIGWGWLALPATVVLATIILLGMTVLATGNQPLWKGSPLVLAFHGPNGAVWRDAGCGEEAGDLNTVEGMEKGAKSIIVRLEHSQGVSRLVPTRAG